MLPSPKRLRASYDETKSNRNCGNWSIIKIKLEIMVFYHFWRLGSGELPGGGSSKAEAKLLRMTSYFCQANVVHRWKLQEVALDWSEAWRIGMEWNGKERRRQFLRHVGPKPLRSLLVKDSTLNYAWKTTRRQCRLESTGVMCSRWPTALKVAHHVLHQLQFPDSPNGQPP